MSKEETVVRFDNVSFAYDEDTVVLDKANFNVRRYSKVTIMGQNGAGKSTIFKLLTQKLQPTNGKIHVDNNATVAIAEQVVPREMFDLTIKEYFATAFEHEKPDIEKSIHQVLDMVNLEIDIFLKVRDLSGGQKM